MVYFEFTFRSRTDPGDATAEARLEMREFAQSARPELLAALAGVGVLPDDYELIEQARAIVDEVNARLRRRGSLMIYTIAFCNAVSLPDTDLSVGLDAPCE